MAWRSRRSAVSLEVRRVHDQRPAGPGDARQLGDEGARRRRRARACPPPPRGRTRRPRRAGASPSTRCTSVSTSSRMEATASAVRSAEAQRPPRAAQQQADDAVVGAEVEAAQALGRAEHGRDLRQLALLQHRAAEEASGPGLRLSHGAPRAGSPASPGRGVRPSAPAPRLQRRATAPPRRSARWRAMGSTNCGRRAVDPEARGGERRLAPRASRRPRTAACRPRRPS